MKKLLTVIFTAALLLIFLIPATAAQAPGDVVTVEGFAFHCGHGGNGNGKTTIAGQAKDFGKFDKKTGEGTIELVRSDWDPTVWVVPHNDFECAVCGNNIWVSYSNKNGVPDGKNIQLNGIGRYDKPVDPIVFDITVFHRVAGSGEYLVYPGVGEFFSSTDEAYVEWLNDVNGFTFLNLYLAATRNNDPASLSSVEGYVCSDVEATGGADLFKLEKFGAGENISALITPVADGSYEVTFWYVKDVPPVQHIVDYYAICQIWNDLMWGNDGYGLTQNYNLSAETKALMMPVGIDHRTALMAFWNTDDMNVRYVPFSLDMVDFCEQWSAYIRYTKVGGVSLQTVCDDLGIDIDEFIAGYDYEGFVDRHGLREAPPVEPAAAEISLPELEPEVESEPVQELEEPESADQELVLEELPAEVPVEEPAEAEEVVEEVE